jgi:hypothetical protein
MMLQEDDLPPSMELYSEGYEDFPAALSSHSASYYAESSSGPFSNVYQTASLMPSTNSAAYAGAFRGAELLTEQLEYYSYPGYFTQVTPVDLSAVGDEAQGEIITISGDGYTRSVAVITLHSGSVADVVFASRRIPIDPSDVAPLAQAAADRLDAALGP